MPLREESCRSSCIYSGPLHRYSRSAISVSPHFLAGIFLVREAIAFNAELTDESTWLWLTSEQPFRPTGGQEHEERAEDLDSSQGVRDHLVAYHLVPVITDFILDENQECCNNNLK